MLHFLSRNLSDHIQQHNISLILQPSKQSILINPHLDDESNNIAFPSTPPVPAKTTWTLLIYLTGLATGCVGGETIFYPELGAAKHFSGKDTEGTEPIAVGLEVGMALLHKHGQDCLLHEGAEVKEGEKWVIRSDLCVRR